MGSGSVFSETLQTITTTKLEELAQQRIVFDERYAALLAAAKAEQDPLKRLIVLADGTKSCLGVKTDNSNHKSKDGRPGRVISGGTRNPRLETDLRNLDRFLEQAEFDPSVSAKVLEDWEKILLQYLSIQASKFQYADLYGKLVTEWLSSEKATATGTGGDVEMSDSFEELPGAKKLAARTEWEKNVFEPAVVGMEALRAYLEQLFIIEKKASALAIKELRSEVEHFENSLGGPAKFNIPTLRWVIKGLQASDLLPNDKREVLKDFLSNDVILGEIGDVLSMRLSALDRWSWGDHVPLEQRRKLNGSYGIHMHEDVLQAIFLHYIGVKWSVFFKAAFRRIRKQSAWKSYRAEIPKTDLRRRDYFLGKHWTKRYSTLEERRDEAQRNRYFAHQLLDFDTQEVEIEEGEEEADYGDHVDASKKRKLDVMAAQQQQMAPQLRQAQQSVRRGAATRFLKDGETEVDEECEASDDDDMGFGLFDDDPAVPPPGPKRPMEAKQDLLHLVSTEVIVNTRLYGELSCFRTVFDSWNPLLPHQTTLQVLEFFGVSEKWRAFFTKFLQAPLKFIDDGPSAESRLRRRGAPDSHALSDVLGETVLFCLDFSVNQATDGALLHRLYDDVWFWNKDYETCAKAWACVTHFTEIMGVKLHDNKTGSVRIAQDKTLTIDKRLPEGEIRWGFLYLDPSNGRFEIDQKMVDSHIDDLRNQLQSKSKSVIDWIQVWNSYAATFFSSNFGKPSNCFGREHVDKMLATHRHIQQRIFPSGNVVQHLKTLISERFQVDSVPDGFLYFPVELGGLDLKSPFVPLLQIREAVRENPYDLLDEFIEKEQDDYVAAKKRFDSGDVRYDREIKNDANNGPWAPSEDTDTFMPLAEFTKYRTSLSSNGVAKIRETYNTLLVQPSQTPVEASVQVRQALEQLRGQANLRGIVANWESMDAYWKWMAQMYGPEMCIRFGGLSVVEPGLLPIGMVGFFRARRTKWMG